MTVTQKKAHELQPGDVILFGDQWMEVADVLAPLRPVLKFSDMVTDRDNPNITGSYNDVQDFIVRVEFTTRLVVRIPCRNTVKVQNAEVDIPA